MNASYSGAAPGDGRDLRRLRNERGPNLVSECSHRLRWRAEKNKPLLLESGGEVWILRSVTPTGPHGIHFRSLSNLGGEQRNIPGIKVEYKEQDSANDGSKRRCDQLFGDRSAGTLLQVTLTQRRKS